jgi:hypothetical protein
MSEAAFGLGNRVGLGRRHELKRIEDVGACLVARAALAEDAGDSGIDATIQPSSSSS